MDRLTGDLRAALMGEPEGRKHEGENQDDIMNSFASKYCFGQGTMPASPCGDFCGDGTLFSF